MKASLISAVALVPAALGATVPRSAKVDYTGFKGLRITLPEGSENLADQINELAATILNPGAKEQLDVVVSPDNVDAISQLAVNTTILLEDVGAAFADEDMATVYAVPSETWFTSYHSYADHLTFLRDLQSSFPGQSEITTAGSSFQGRALTGIHIWGSGGKGSKPAVVLHGTVHAREWISTMTTEYVAWQLLTKYATDSAIKAVVDKFDWYITPVVNPDGFVYTQSTDRLWRKNRQTNTGSSCIGRDPNRNWPYKWELTGGASTSPCAETYKGAAAADTPEIKGLKAQIDSLCHELWHAAMGIRSVVKVA
ncbi:zinc carboxypeptidase [Colletotrichum lupini]|uniref:Zinc carboxypeptidase n=1 Tax=Colletotrichum lupini TaxID=145971 RepID=A0A9Q8WA41_9PEZI|nr:zinc carboxypeptidase [Colletotrichum lupini]UQC76268.1 zinc carboxypeptidase [Colletotrichum lupini]